MNPAPPEMRTRFGMPGEYRRTLPTLGAKPADGKVWSVQRVFMTRQFARWADREGIEESLLCLAVQEMQRGLIDADLGHGLVKKRLPMRGQGKRGGGRTLVATNKGTRWFFVFGFAKNERPDVPRKALVEFGRLAADLLGSTDFDLTRAVERTELREICYA